MKPFFTGIAVLIPLFYCSGSAFAQVDALSTTVDSIFAEYGHNEGPGCAVGVSSEGRIQLLRGYGFASLEHSVPIAPETVFDVGSVSKQFTAAAVALLVKDRKVSLDASVRTYLPEMPAYERPVTVRHLLHHTGGLRDVFTLWELQGRHEQDVYTPEDVLQTVAAQDDLDPEPGARFEYSNTGYLVLGRLVERVTGQSLGTFTREQFFEPLGMNQTLFYEDRKAVIPNRATGYAPSNAGYEIAQYVNFAMGGDGQLFTTVGDLLRWHDYLYSDAGDAAGVPSITDLLHTPGRLASGDSLDYALGLFVEDFRGLKEIRHHGVWGGFRAYLTRFPEASVSIAVLCNRADVSPWAAGHEIVAMMLADQVTPATASSDNNENSIVVDVGLLDAYSGRYEVENMGIVLTFAREGSILTITQDDDPVRLQTVNDSTFASNAAGFMIIFHRDTDGAVEHGTLKVEPDNLLRLLLNAGSDNILRRLVPWSPSAENLASYAGTYYSPQMETSYMIVAEDGGLLLKHRRRDDMRVEPKEENAFSGDFPFMSVTFERDENNRVMGFHVMAGGTQDVRFEKQD